MAGQLIMLLALPLIAMGYGPEEVGEYNFLFSSGYLLACLLCFRLELGILKEREEDALLASRICNRIALTSLFFLFCLMLLFSQRSSSDFLYILFLGAFWHLVAIGHYLSVQRRYLTLSIIRIVPALFFLIVLAYSVLFEIHVPIFDLHAVSWVLFVVLFLFFLVVGKGKNAVVINYGLCRSFFHKHRRLLYYQLPADLLCDITRFVMPLLIPLFYGNHAAGLYMVASKLLFFPLTLLSTSLGVVFRREAIAVFYQKEKFLLIFKSVLMLLFVVMMLYIVGSYFFVRPVMQLLFSDVWIDAIDIAMAMIPSVAMSIMYETLSHVFFILNRQHYHLMVYGTILLVAMLIVTASSYLEIGFLDSLYLFSWSIFIIQFIGVVFCCRCVNAYIKAYEENGVDDFSIKAGK